MMVCPGCGAVGSGFLHKVGQLGGLPRRRIAKKNVIDISCLRGIGVSRLRSGDDSCACKAVTQAKLKNVLMVKRISVCIAFSF